MVKNRNEIVILSNVNKFTKFSGTRLPKATSVPQNPDVIVRVRIFRLKKVKI